MILEGLVTTVGDGGAVNFAPMGPLVDESMTRLVLKPFQSSTTFANLQARPEGVFHVIDDVLLLARAAIGTVDPPPETLPAEVVEGVVVGGACRWYEFRIENVDLSGERAELTARIVHSGRLRDVFGFHRARHAVLEAAILATRVHLLPPAELQQQFAALKVIVGKTAGPRELEAFAVLEDHVGLALERPTRVELTTGARLHFGLLAHGRDAARQFGGAGVMLETPAVRLAGEPAEHDEVLGEGPAADRASQFLFQIRESFPPRNNACRLSVEEAIPSHTGLGSGTQLGLAVARVLAQVDGQQPAAVALAERVGRGARSGIGIHGFDVGGFLVDAGRRSRETVAPLVARLDVPGDWRFVLAGPPRQEPGEQAGQGGHGGQGLSGASEREAFARMEPMPEATSAGLSRLLLQRILPAFRVEAIDEAAEGLYEYGRQVGESFAGVQGGTYAHPDMAALVGWAREAGIRGVGQSSWGPTIWMLCGDPETAEGLARDVGQRPGVGWCQVARPRNRGADVTLVVGQPLRTLSNSG